MPIVQAKCENCGGILAVDSSQKAAVCPFCNTPYVVQDAINNYNITNNVNVGAGAVVNVYGNANNDFEIEAGVLKKYKGASCEVVIPDNVVTIEYAAFQNMPITKVTISKSVKTIHASFQPCPNLDSINVDDDNTDFSSVNGVLFDKNKTKIIFYPRNKKDKSYTIPDGVVTIVSEAFKANSYLETIVVPNSMREICDDAFRNCSKLISINIPDNALIIGSRILDGTPYIENENNWTKQGHFGLLYNGHCLLKVKELGDDNPWEKNINIVEGTRVIAELAFYDISACIRFPDSVVSVNSFAFTNHSYYEKSFSNGMYDIFPHECIELINQPKNLEYVTPCSFDGTREYIEPAPITEKKKKGCYVATAIYGSYDCPQVWTLRRYRDDRLDATWYGRLFIMLYYAISPTLVKWFGHTVWFNKLWKSKLDRMVERLNAEGYEDTPYNDKY